MLLNIEVGDVPARPARGRAEDAAEGGAPTPPSKVGRKRKIVARLKRHNEAEKRKRKRLSHSLERSAADAATREGGSPAEPAPVESALETDQGPASAPTPASVQVPPAHVSRHKPKPAPAPAPAPAPPRPERVQAKHDARSAFDKVATASHASAVPAVAKSSASALSGTNAIPAAKTATSAAMPAASSGKAANATAPAVPVTSASETASKTSGKTTASVAMRESNPRGEPRNQPDNKPASVSVRAGKPEGKSEDKPDKPAGEPASAPPAPAVVTPAGGKAVGGKRAVTKPATTKPAATEPAATKPAAALTGKHAGIAVVAPPVTLPTASKAASSMPSAGKVAAGQAGVKQLASKSVTDDPDLESGGEYDSEEELRQLQRVAPPEVVRGKGARPSDKPDARLTDKPDAWPADTSGAQLVDKPGARPADKADRRSAAGKVSAAAAPKSASASDKAATAVTGFPAAGLAGSAHAHIAEPAPAANRTRQPVPAAREENAELAPKAAGKKSARTVSFLPAPLKGHVSAVASAPASAPAPSKTAISPARAGQGSASLIGSRKRARDESDSGTEGEAAAGDPAARAAGRSAERAAARLAARAASEPSSEPPGARDAFEGLGICCPLVDELVRPDADGGMGFVSPTAVQRLAIPQILARRDVLVRSQTGSGKTLAFGLPILHMLQAQGRVSRTDGISALVLSPTRELCFQITQVLERAARPFFWVVIGSLVGGEKRKSEKARLRRGFNVLVATPGRLLDHLEHTETLRDSLRQGKLRWLVLDEADRLTDAGFIKQVGQVLDWLEQNAGAGGVAAPAEAQARLQAVLVSATLNSKVQELAKRILNDHVTIEVDAPPPKRSPSEQGDGDGEGEPGDGHEHKDARNHKDGAGAGDDDGGGSGGGGDGDGMASEGSVQEPLAEAGKEELILYMPKTLMQHYMLVPSKERLVALSAFVLRQVKRYKYAVKIVLFVSCRAVVDFLHATMTRLEWPPRASGAKAAAAAVARGAGSGSGPGLGTKWWKLHGSVDQKERRRAVAEFSKAKHGVLICTDVAARGLDLPHVDWIVQYDPPSEVSEYVHRVGRTARSGRSGSALILLTPDEKEYVALLEARQARLVEIKLDSMFAALSKYATAGAGEAQDEGEAEGAIAAYRRPRPAPGKPATIQARAAYDPDAAAGLLHLRLADLVQGSTQEQARHAAQAGQDARPSGARDGDTAPELERRGARAGPTLRVLAEEAFVAFVRAYAVHSKETKQIFVPKKLHLGHVAKSFGLSEEPKGVGSKASHRFKERVKKKDERASKRDFEKAARRLTSSREFDMPKRKKARRS